MLLLLDVFRHDSNFKPLRRWLDSHWPHRCFLNHQHVNRLEAPHPFASINDHQDLPTYQDAHL